METERKLPESSTQTPLLSNIELVTTPKWSWKTWAVWFMGIFAFYLYLQFVEGTMNIGTPVFAILVSGITSAFASSMSYGSYYLVKKFWYRSFRAHEGKIERISTKTEVLQEQLEQDFFTNLIKINFKYLDKYYLQTQVQGDKSFVLCVVAAVLGLCIIIAGIVMMFFGKTEPAYVATASGVIGEFISAVFFFLYTRTVIKMSEYHQKLVLTQNIALSLKIAENLPEHERVITQQKLVEALTKDVNFLLAQQANFLGDTGHKNREAK